MNKRLLNIINIFLASVIAFLGYGCGAKKNVVQTSEKVEIESEIEQNMIAMYGVPVNLTGVVFDTIPADLSDSVPQKPKPKVKPDETPIRVKYGVRFPY